MSRVRAEHNVVVLPVIDMIDPLTFEYKSSPKVRGGFTWTLHFSWETIPSSDLEYEPFYVK